MHCHSDQVQNDEVDLQRFARMSIEVRRRPLRGLPAAMIDVIVIYSVDVR